MAMRFTVVLEGQRYEVEVSDGLQVRVNGRTYRARVRAEGPVYKVSVGGQTFDLRVQGRTLVLGDRRLDVRFEGYDHHPLTSAEAPRAAALGMVKAPMPGRVVAVIVKEGERVSLGAPLLILEAMKMQNEVPSPAEGVVKEIRVAPGAIVGKEDVLMVIQ
jgi:pyruvate carboxylase subunit B